jgi:cathepsin B
VIPSLKKFKRKDYAVLVGRVSIFLTNLKNKVIFVAAASVLTDRRCIKHGPGNPRISADDLLSCCPDCTSTGNGCNGGSSLKAYRYFTQTGIVSGGDFHTFGTADGHCKPYPYKPDDPSPSSTPCVDTCQADFTQATYEGDRKTGDNYFQLSYDTKEVMYELMNNGPVSCR